jgi:hypothetical protein
MKRRKAGLIDHIFRKNYLIKHTVERERRRGRSEGKTRKKTYETTRWP